MLIPTEPFATFFDFLFRVDIKPSPVSDIHLTLNLRSPKAPTEVIKLEVKTGYRRMEANPYFRYAALTSKLEF